MGSRVNTSQTTPSSNMRLCVRLRYKFRFYPTVEQEQHLARVFGCCRYVYNWGLNLRRSSFHEGKKIYYAATSAALTELKRDAEHLWLNDVSCVPVQQALRHLQTAYKAFFEKRARYPKFKRKRGEQSAEYTRSAFKWDGHALSVSQLGNLRVRWSREFASEPSTVTIAKDCAGRYFVSLCLDEKICHLPKTGDAVGVDLGIKHLATLSTGEHIENPRHLAHQLQRLARSQRSLARRKKGSKRRERQKLLVAKIHARVADARADALHKLTTGLVRRFDTICIEDLNVRGMVKNRHLACALADAAFGIFHRQIEYKCDWYGKTMALVDRFFPSSKMCSACGHVLDELPLSVREWDCPKCGAHHDRDENAAQNILAAGLAALAQGGGRRRPVASTTRRSPRRTANHPMEGALHCAPHLS